MRYTIIAISLGVIIALLSCNSDRQDATEENSTILLSDEASTSIERYFQLPIEERKVKAGEMMMRYLALKDEDSDASLQALKNAFYIIAKGEHPLMEEWLEIAPRIIGVDEGLLTDLQRFNEIELEIAQYNNEDREYINELDEFHKELEEQIDDLKAQGVDPNTFKVSFKVEVE